MKIKQKAEKNTNPKNRLSLKRLISPGTTLKEKTVKGGFWLFSFQIFNRLVQFIRTVILARLLSPNDFGLFGIALLALTVLETFSRTGFSQALIQRKEDIKSHLNTAWTAGIIRGFLIAGILFFIAPYTATFFNSPSAEPVVKVIGLAFILNSFANIAIIYFEKELEFHKYFIYQFTGTVVNVIVTITAAFILRSVWALIYGLLAENFVKCILSYFIDRYRPKLHLDLQKAKELFGFGKWILGSSILAFLLTQGDDIFVGKILGATALGFYQMAYRISNMPTSEYMRIITRITFPAFSKLQEDFAKLDDAYMKVLKFTSILIIPMAGIIFILSPEFTKLFLGEKWMPMVPAMQVLACYTMLRSIGAAPQSVFTAIGRPDLVTKMQSGQLILLAILIYPLTSSWQLFGTSLAVMISVLILTPVAFYILFKMIKSDSKAHLKTILLPLTSTLAMVFVVFITKTYLLSHVGFLAFFLLAGEGIVIYIVLTYLFDRYLNYGSRQLLKDQFATLFQKHKREADDS